MRKLREDIQLVAAVATILLALGALVSWMASWPDHLLLLTWGIAGLAVVLTYGVIVAIPWLQARYREAEDAASDIPGPSVALGNAEASPESDVAVHMARRVFGPGPAQDAQRAEDSPASRG